MGDFLWVNKMKLYFDFILALFQKDFLTVLYIGQKENELSTGMSFTCLIDKNIMIQDQHKRQIISPVTHVEDFVVLYQRLI